MNHKTINSTESIRMQEKKFNADMQRVFSQMVLPFINISVTANLAMTPVPQGSRGLQSKLVLKTKIS